MLVQFATDSSHVVLHRLSSTWEWYMVRGAGFAAAGLLILLMLSGIGQVTGYTYRFMEPVKAWIVHKALAIALCVAIAVHMIFLLLDHFVSFSLISVLFPFVSHYSNGVGVFGLQLNTWAVALGIFAMYGVGIIVLSSLLFIDSKKKTWRWLHYLSYFVMLFTFIHGLAAGSDLKTGWLRILWYTLLILVALAVVSRLMRAGTLRRNH